MKGLLIRWVINALALILISSWIANAFINDHGRIEYIEFHTRP